MENKLQPAFMAVLRERLDAILQTGAHAVDARSTRGDIYFIRNARGEMEYYSGVESPARREFLCRLCQYPVKTASYWLGEGIVISSNPISVPLDFFCQLAESALPGFLCTRYPALAVNGNYLRHLVALILVKPAPSESSGVQQERYRLYCLFTDMTANMQLSISVQPDGSINVSDSLHPVLAPVYRYCAGVGCDLRERCTRFLEGRKLPAGEWSWQHDCGEGRDGFLPVARITVNE